MKEDVADKPKAQKVVEGPEEGMKDGSCGLPSKCVVS